MDGRRWWKRDRSTKSWVHAKRYGSTGSPSRTSTTSTLARSRDGRVNLSAHHRNSLQVKIDHN
jgi:hypothetical protein